MRFRKTGVLDRRRDESRTKFGQHSGINYLSSERKIWRGSVFFKTHRNAFYADSAVCKRCGSTVIEFDIELSDEVLAEMSRLSKRPKEELTSEIEALAERIAGDDRNAEQGAAPDAPDRRAGEL